MRTVLDQSNGGSREGNPGWGKLSAEMKALVGKSRPVVQGPPLVGQAHGRDKPVVPRPPLVGQAHGRDKPVVQRAPIVGLAHGRDKRKNGGAERTVRPAAASCSLYGNITKWGPQAETYVYQQSGNPDGPELIFISEHHLRNTDLARVVRKLQ